MVAKLDLKVNDEVFEKECLALIKSKITELVRKSVDAKVNDITDETLKKKDDFIRRHIQDELTGYKLSTDISRMLGDKIRDCIRYEFLNSDDNLNFNTRQMITEIMKEVLDKNVEEYVRTEIDRCLKLEIRKLVESKVADGLKEVLK